MQRSLAVGMVPVYEEHVARLERGIRLSEWSDMDEMEKALVIAERRTRNAMSNLQSEAEIKQAERNSRKR